MKLERKRSVTTLMLVAILAVITLTPLTAGQKYGGTLVIGLQVTPRTLNGATTSAGAEHIFVAPLYDTLVNYDEKLEPHPGLAESWEMSPDGKTWTWHLREDVTWHDGEPFTSADVKFSVEEVLVKYNAGSKGDLWATLDHIETPDDYTVVAKLTAPWAAMERYIGYRNYMTIIPKHLYEGTDILENPHNWDPVGTGPFKFVEYVEADHLTLERYDGYYQKDKPYLDKVIFRIMPSADAMVMALETGEIHYQPRYTPPWELERLNAIEGIKAGSLTTATMSQERVVFNMCDPILSNLKVRQAICRAIDRETIMETVTYGTGLISDGPFNPRGPFLEWIYEGRSPLEWPYPYDVNEANRLLDEAGYPKGSDGIRFKKRYTHSTLYPRYEKVAALVKDYLAEVGIEIEIISLERLAWQDTIFKKWDYDITYSTSSICPDPSRIRTYFHSDGIEKGAVWANFARYNSSRVDELFDKGAVELDPAKRAEYYYDIQDQMQKDAASVWMFVCKTAFAASEEFVGLPLFEGCGWGADMIENVYWEMGEAPPPEFPWTEVAIVVAVVAVIAVVAIVYWRTRK